jgi:hypothetical protein
MININQDTSNELVFYVNKTETYFLLKFIKEDTGAIKRCICTDSSTQIGAIILTLVEVGTGAEDILNGEVALGVGGWDLYLYEQSSATNIDENLAEYLHHEDCYVYGDIAESKSPKCKPVTIVDGLSIVSKNAGEAYTCSSGVCADATVNVNGNLFDTVASGGTLEVPVEYENGTPVGTIAGGVVEIPNPVTCADATAVLKDTALNTISTTNIASGASADITAPDATAVIKDTAGNTLKTEAILSGASEDITINDANISINATPFTTVLAEGTANIPVKNTAADNVGSDNTGVWEVADATIENSDASYSTTVKAEGTKVLPDTDYEVYVNGILNTSFSLATLKTETITITL